VSLTVQFNAAVSDAITSYNWDFGDGNVAMGPSQTHVYNQPGIYVTQLTVTDTQNREYSVEKTVNVFASLDNSSVIVPNTALFFDNFDYVAARDDANVMSAFQSLGGWNFVKTAQDPNAGGAFQATQAPSLAAIPTGFWPLRQDQPLSTAKPTSIWSTAMHSVQPKIFPAMSGSSSGFTQTTTILLTTRTIN